LVEDNPCLISPEPKQQYEFEIKGEAHLVKKKPARPATKRSTRESETEETPPKKRPRKPKPAAAPTKRKKG
jgi:hypothetical protein